MGFLMNKRKSVWNKTWIKRVFSFVLVLVMMLTMIPFSSEQTVKAEESENTKTIYLCPGTLWETAGAWFSVYVFNTGDAYNQTMYKMADLDLDGYYEAEIPASTITH